MSRARAGLLLALAFLHLSLGAGLMLVVAAATLFLARERYGRLASWLSRGLLRLWGVRVVVEGEPLPTRQVVYVSNHTSALDVFVICALGLPRTRYFLSGGLRAVVPLGVIGALIGVFWTAPQSRPARRVALFQRAARTLARTGESVFLTPEGERVRTGRIGHFNKGGVHLAIALRAPLVPLFLDTPDEVDPGMGLVTGAGVVRVRVGAPIETSAWTVDELERRRDELRGVYVAWNDARRVASRV